MSRSESDRPLEWARRAQDGQRFNRALDRLRRSRDLSFQAVSNNAGRQRLPKSTAHMMCTRDTLPTRAAQVEAFVRACGEPPGDVAAWLAEWRRIDERERRLRTEHRIAGKSRRHTAHHPAGAPIPVGADAGVDADDRAVAGTAVDADVQAVAGADVQAMAGVAVGAAGVTAGVTADAPVGPAVDVVHGAAVGPMDSARGSTAEAGASRRVAPAVPAPAAGPDDEPRPAAAPPTRRAVRAVLGGITAALVVAAVIAVGMAPADPAGRGRAVVDALVPDLAVSLALVGVVRPQPGRPAEGFARCEDPDVPPGSSR
ncbi:hypothetical protein [Saccharothrix australiensis]|uniref:Helix-turn-helix protein n=1 Tax=Saccharothrix australiensis TaxID=2072 RepID=A0A495W521_9PSEU|nr:hypothetical protein [Saccharothrix australiensis]RKT56147.1 hypothetical protein C8E97_4836 [Saccharothrix australiensis]